MNKTEKRCHICKKRFNREEIDYCCDSCEDDLSDSQRKRDVALKKQKRIRKIEGSKGEKDRKEKMGKSFSTRLEIEQFNDNIYMEEKRTLSAEQYEYFVYLTLNSRFLSQHEKNRLADINSRSSRHQNQSQDKVIKQCGKLGYEKSQVWSLIHYLESEAPIVIYFNINKDIGEFLRDPLVSTDNRTTKNGVIGQISICSDLKRNSSMKFYGQSFLVLKENVRKRCFLRGQWQKNHVPFTNLIYSEHMLAGLPIRQLKQCIDALHSQQEDGLNKQIYIMGKILLNKHVEVIYVNKKEAKGNYESMLRQIRSKYGVDFQFF